MRALNNKWLETFIWVATLGSFRKAAARLYTTQQVRARVAGQLLLQQRDGHRVRKPCASGVGGGMLGLQLAVYSTRPSMARRPAPVTREAVAAP